MPYINLNGQLVEVTQEQYDIYTVGQNQNQVATQQTPAQAAAAVAAGGTTTENNSATTPILTPNTTNNTPGQTLQQGAVSVNTDAGAVSSNTVPTTISSSIAAGDINADSITTTNITASATTISDSLVANSASSVYASATAGLTVEQLLALGGADPTDPYIRARLGLPALSDVQTLSGAIGNVNFSNIGTAISNTISSFGNAVSDINLANIGDAIGNAASSFGNAVGNIGDLFSSSTATSVPASEIQTLSNAIASGDITASDVIAASTGVADSAVVTATTDVNATVDPQSPTEATTISDSLATTTGSTSVDVATADAGSGTTVGTDTNAVPASQIDVAPDAVSPEVDPQASLAPGEEIVPPSEVNYSPGELDAIAAGQGVAGEQGNITGDTLARDPGNYTADELNAIADAQGVAGEEGNITADTLARDPGSFTADELNAIVDAQGVAGEEGNITADSLAKDPGSYTADELDAIIAAQGVAAGDGPIEPTNTGVGTSADGAAASSNIQGLVQNAQAQATIASQRKQINNGDWRVRLRLAPLSNYLYNAPNPGILQPLKVTDGIIFPYTPSIDTNYRANYEAYDLTHSNYRGYFYKNSYVDTINLRAVFTAQDTSEANYLLAVITFLKSATKMFYGQDAQRGAPPPVLYLTGLGDYQFREHPCLLNAFTYNLPADVDYIRAGSPNNVGLNLTSIRDRQSVATNSVFGSLNRLAAAFLTKGAVTGPAAPPTLGLNRPTYVPTKIEINLTLYPIQSRQQVSQQFSVKEFANGNLIKGGFW